MNNENSNINTFYEGLENIVDNEEFKKKRKALQDVAFDKIIKDTYEGKITWNRDMSDLDKTKYIAEVTVENMAGKEITIPVFLRFTWYYSAHEFGYLSLFNKDGPTRNTAYPPLKELAEKYFKINFKQKDALEEVHK